MSLTSYRDVFTACPRGSCAPVAAESVFYASSPLAHFEENCAVSSGNARPFPRARSSRRGSWRGTAGGSLGVVERRGVEDLGRDRPVPGGGQRGLVRVAARSAARAGLRRRRRCRSGTACRRRCPAASLRRVVGLPEDLEQAPVVDASRIVDHEHHLVVAGAAGADLVVGRVRVKPAA